MSYEPLEALERYYRAIEPKPVPKRSFMASMADLLVGSSIGLALAGLAVALVLRSPSDSGAAERSWALHLKHQLQPLAEAPAPPRRHSENPSWRV
jgi:hypothetical protein